MHIRVYLALSRCYLSVPGLATRMAVQDMDIFVSYNACVVLGSPGETLHSHAGICHRKSSVAYTGSLPV